MFVISDEFLSCCVFSTLFAVWAQEISVPTWTSMLESASRSISHSMSIPKPQTIPKHPEQHFTARQELGACRAKDVSRCQSDTCSAASMQSKSWRFWRMASVKTKLPKPVCTQPLTTFATTQKLGWVRKFRWLSGMARCTYIDKMLFPLSTSQIQIYIPLRRMNASIVSSSRLPAGQLSNNYHLL